MSKITLNSISNSVFAVNSAETKDGSKTRAEIVGAGRLLNYEYACRGQNAVNATLGRTAENAAPRLNSAQYKALNERFQQDHLMYAAHKCCEMTGREAPESYEAFKKRARQYYNDKNFFAVLSGIYEEIIQPVLPAVFSTAIDVFAETVQVSSTETYTVSVESDDIPIFQDSSWGAQRSVPRNRFYAKDYVLRPQPKTAQINAKWMQLVGNNADFGKFFANIAAGMYAKTLGMWSQAMGLAAADTTLIPSGLSYLFNQDNWVICANKVAALNATSMDNVIAYGSPLALSRVLPTNVTGSTSAAMDAAIATLLGAEYVSSGYLGQYMRVRLMPLQDAVVSNTIHGSVDTILDNNKIWLMSSTGRKPMTIAYDADTPMTIEINPIESADFEIGLNLTTALDTLALFSSKCGLITVA